MPEAAIRRSRGEPESPKRAVCVVSPQEFEYSQTFVREHVRRLPADVKVLYGSSVGRRSLAEKLADGVYFPTRLADGRSLTSVAASAADLALRRVLHTQRRPFAERALARYLRRQRVDAVLAEFGRTGIGVMRACQAASVPLVVHFHGNDAYNQKHLDQYRDAYRELFAAVAAVVAVSRDMVERLAKLGAPRERLFYNPCGVDVELFAGADPGSAPPTFLAVGRFVHKKAPHLTLRAFRRVLAGCSEARLTMIGDGALLERCRQETRECGMEKAVTFLGVRSHEEVATTMGQVRAFVQHSVRGRNGNAEGTPVALLEAGASRLPAVSTHHGGIPDVVVHGETGFLTAEHDVEGMARHMLQLARSPALARTMGEKARERVCAEFSMEERIAALAKIIEQAIPRPPAVNALAHRTRRAKPHPTPIFMIGNQKSGTSAIASLLGAMTGLDVTIDLRREIRSPSFERVKRGELSFAAFVRRNRLDFSRPLIKAPNLTVFYDELREFFDSPRFVFIVRDPRDNLRSILDRLRLPGDQERLTPEQWQSVPPPWQLIVDGGWLGLRGEGYIEMLAARWNLCADVYLAQPEAFVPIRYEDFQRDKRRELGRLAGALELTPVRDVSDRLDHPFQPRGAHRNVPWEDFFGANLERITRICAERMAKFGYEAPS